MDALQNVEPFDISASDSSPSLLPYRSQRVDLNNTVRNHRVVAMAKTGMRALLIGRELGMTKNAVIGALWRAAKRGEYVRPRASYAPESLDAPSMDKRLGIDRISLRGCCWVIGELGGEWHYCGERATHPGGSWCSTHYATVYYTKPREGAA